MKATLGIAGAAVVLTLSLAAPVAAQERGAHGGGGGGERHNSSGGGGGGGQAVERGGGGAMSSGSSDGGGFSGASGSSGGSAGGGFGTGPGSATAVGRISSHPGPSPLGHAAFRGRDGERLGDAGGRSIVFGGPMGAADPSVDPGTRAIPPGSRPNRSNPSVGTAVERSSLPSGGGNGYYNWYDYYTPGYFAGISSYYNRYGMLGYYSPYAMYYGNSWYYPFDPDYLYGYGAFGIGSFYYDPMWWGGAGYGGIGGGAGSSSYSKSESSGPKGGLKLRITPDTAAVYVDGTYYGIVDQFDSAFQRLELPVGAHHVELQAKGYQPLAFDVSIDRNDTVSYRGTMTPGQQK